MHVGVIDEMEEENKAKAKAFLQRRKAANKAGASQAASAKTSKDVPSSSPADSATSVSPTSEAAEPAGAVLTDEEYEMYERERMAANEKMRDIVILHLAGMELRPFITLRLRDSEETRSMWPHKFELLYKVRVCILGCAMCTGAGNQGT